MTAIGSSVAIVDTNKIVRGTGSFVASRGRPLIATASHIFNNYAPNPEGQPWFVRVIKEDGVVEDRPVTLLGRHPQVDIAALTMDRIPEGYQPLPAAPIDVLRPNDRLHLKGFGPPPETPGIFKEWSATARYVGPLQHGYINLEGDQVNKGASGAAWVSPLDGAIVAIQTHRFSPGGHAQNERACVAVSITQLGGVPGVEQDEMVVLRGTGIRGKPLRDASISYHIDSLVARYARPDGGALRALRPSVAEVRDQPRAATRPNVRPHCILYGPPEVGKTTWAVHELLEHESAHGLESALYFNLNIDSPDELHKCTERWGDRNDDRRPVLVILDDAHIATAQGGLLLKQWHAAVTELRQRRRALGDEATWTIWIARAPKRVAEVVRDVGSAPFPADGISSAFQQLQNTQLWYGMVCAFETRMDPRTLASLSERSMRVKVPELPSSSQFEVFREAVESMSAEQSLRWVLEQSERLADHVGGTDAFDLFLLLLPVATIDIPVPIAVCRRLIPTALRSVRLLERHGLATSELVSQGGRAQRSLRLNVHAYHAARVLHRIDENEMPDVRVPSGAMATGREGGVTSGVAFAYRVLALLVQDVAENRRAYTVDELTERAQWSGVPELMCGGLDAWLNASMGVGRYAGAVEQQAAAGYDKLVRLSRRELDVARSLEIPDAYSEVVAAKRDQLRLAVKAVERVPVWDDATRLGKMLAQREVRQLHDRTSSTRLDTALYEIGYRLHLRGQFREAMLYMQLSMASAMSGICGDDGHVIYDKKETVGVLSHVWVSASVAMECEMYMLFDDALRTRDHALDDDAAQRLGVIIERLGYLAKATMRIAVAIEQLLKREEPRLQTDDVSERSKIIADAGSVLHYCMQLPSTQVVNVHPHEWRLDDMRAIGRKAWERAAQLWEYAERAKYYACMLGLHDRVVGKVVWGNDDGFPQKDWERCESRAQELSEYPVGPADQLHRDTRAAWGLNRQSNDLDKLILSRAVSAAMIHYVQGPPEGLAWHLLLAYRVAADMGDQVTREAVCWVADRYARDIGSGRLAVAAMRQGL